MNKADFEKEMKTIFGPDADASAIKRKLEVELESPLSLEEVVLYCRGSDEAAQSLEGALKTLDALQHIEIDSDEVVRVHELVADGISGSSRTESGSSRRSAVPRGVEKLALRHVEK